MNLCSEAGLSVDTCTLFESLTALEAGLAPAKIGLHGNNKSSEELSLAVKHQFARIILDSEEEIGRVCDAVGALLGSDGGREADIGHERDACQEADASQGLDASRRYAAAESGNSDASRQNNARALKANVFLRVTNGVHAGGHEFISTAHEDQKFGVSLAGGRALQALKQVLKRSELHLQGIHAHIGSQIVDAKAFVESAQKMLQLRTDLHLATGYLLPEIDLGGGFGVQYVSSDAELDLPALFGEIADTIQKHCQENAESLPKVSFEPGRYLIAPCMTTVYSVGSIKQVEYEAGKFRRYIAVDGGMSDNIRPILYGAKYTCFVLPRRPLESATGANADVIGDAYDFEDAPHRDSHAFEDVSNPNAEITRPLFALDTKADGYVLSRVLGKHCESGDILIPETYLPENVQRGDLLCIPVTGAYSYSMASNYNMLPKPAVLRLHSTSEEGEPKQKLSVLIQQQRFEDLIC